MQSTLVGNSAEPKDGLVSFFTFNKATGSALVDSAPGSQVAGALATEGVMHVENLVADASLPVSTVLPTYEYVGVPWLPASITGISDGSGSSSMVHNSGAGAMRGDATVTVKGVNFSPASSQVYFAEAGKDPVGVPTMYVSRNELVAYTPSAIGERTITVKNGDNLGFDESNYEQSVSVEDLATGLCAHFTFHDGMATDVTGKTTPGVVIGAKPSKGRDERVVMEALSFNSSSHSVDVKGILTACDMNTAGYTIATWAKFDYPSYPNGITTSSCPNTQSITSSCAKPGMMYGAFKHVVLSVPSSADLSSKLYVNGEEVPIENAPAYNTFLSTVALTGIIGGSGYAGIVDDLKVYTRPLSSPEAMELYRTRETAAEFLVGSSVAMPRNDAVPTGEPGLRATVTYAMSGETLGTADLGVVAPTFFPFTLPTTEVVAASGPFAIATEYSLTVTGYVHASVAGAHTFTMVSDETAKLLVDGAQVAASSSAAGAKQAIASVNFEAGKWYKIELQYTKLNLAAAPYVHLLHQAPGSYPAPLDSASLRAGYGSFTVSTWIHPYSTAGKQPLVSQARTATATAFQVGIEDGGLFLEMYAENIDGGYVTFTSPAALSSVPANAWTHVAVSYDGKGARFFVDGILTDYNELAETTSASMSDHPIVLGSGKTCDGDVLSYTGQMKSFSLYSTALVLEEDIKETMTCYHKGTKAFAISLELEADFVDGVGLRVLEVSGSDSPMFADGLMTAVARNTNDMRVNATCDTYDAVASSTLLSGTALVESVAGDCYSFSMELYDKCGAKKRFGGDNVTAHVIGPLHLHKELQRLHVGSGVQDMGDGSYMATTTLTLSGYYVVRVYVNGEFAAESETGYVHPAETSMAHSFVYDVEDAVLYNEVVEAPAGVPVSMKIQTVDRFGNLRTTGCDDGWVMKATGPSNFDGSVSDNGDGTYTVSYETVYVPRRHCWPLQVHDHPRWREHLPVGWVHVRRGNAERHEGVHAWLCRGRGLRLLPHRVRGNVSQHHLGPLCDGSRCE